MGKGVRPRAAWGDVRAGPWGHSSDSGEEGGAFQTKSPAGTGGSTVGTAPARGALKGSRDRRSPPWRGRHHGSHRDWRPVSRGPGGRQNTRPQLAPLGNGMSAHGTSDGAGWGLVGRAQGDQMAMRRAGPHGAGRGRGTWPGSWASSHGPSSQTDGPRRAFGHRAPMLGLGSADRSPRLQAAVSGTDATTHDR